MRDRVGGARHRCWQRSWKLRTQSMLQHSWRGRQGGLGVKRAVLDFRDVVYVTVHVEYEEASAI